LSKPAGQGTSREGARRAGAQIRRELARVVLVHPLHLPSAVCQTLSPILCRVYIGAYTQAHPQNYNNKNLTQIELDSNTWTPPNLGGVSPYTFPPNSWTLTPSTHTQDSHICIGAPSTEVPPCCCRFAAPLSADFCSPKVHTPHIMPKTAAIECWPTTHGASLLCTKSTAQSTRHFAPGLFEIGGPHPLALPTPLFQRSDRTC